jgi:hypothetical protein
MTLIPQSFALLTPLEIISAWTNLVRTSCDPATDTIIAAVAPNIAITVGSFNGFNGLSRLFKEPLHHENILRGSEAIINEVEDNDHADMGWAVAFAIRCSVLSVPPMGDKHTDTGSYQASRLMHSRTAFSHLLENELCFIPEWEPDSDDQPIDKTRAIREARAMIQDVIKNIDDASLSEVLRMLKFLWDEFSNRLNLPNCFVRGFRNKKFYEPPSELKSDLAILKLSIVSKLLRHQDEARYHGMDPFSSLYSACVRREEEIEAYGEGLIARDDEPFDEILEAVDEMLEAHYGDDDRPIEQRDLEYQKRVVIRALEITKEQLKAELAEHDVPQATHA